VRLGSVGRPHGRDGAFHVFGATGRLTALDPGRPLMVGGVEHEIAWRGGTAARPLVRLVGVDDRGAAERLKGRALEVSRAQFGALGAGEHFVRDLIGCAVTDGETHVGVVRDVLTLPSVDCLAVSRAGVTDGERSELLVPLVGDAVRSLDVEGRRVDVDLTFVEPG
jgi:16S rRNA processing protein RimM